MEIVVECFCLSVRICPQNILNHKWKLCCSYYPKYLQISYHLGKIGKDLDTLRSQFDKLILISDFNTTPTGTSDFCKI